MLSQPEVTAEESPYPTPGVNNRFGYRGYWYEPKIGRYLVRNRVYDPRFGRWLTRDPIGVAGGWNLYRYCGGRPSGRYDPMGLSWFSDLWDGAVTAVSAVGNAVGDFVADRVYYSAIGLGVGYRTSSITADVTEGVTRATVKAGVFVFGGAVLVAAAPVLEAPTVGVGVWFGIQATVQGGYAAVTGRDLETGAQLTLVERVEGGTNVVLGVTGAKLGADYLLSRQTRVPAGVPSAVSLRQAEMLRGDVGYHIAPESWFARYDTLGRQQTYLTNSKALTDLGLPTVNTIVRAGQLPQSQVRAIDTALGLDPGSLADGFRITRVEGLKSRSPASPIGGGNVYFRGPGKGLPGGGPEITVQPPVPTKPWPPQCGQ